MDLNINISKNRPPSFLKRSYPESSETRQILKHPLDPPIRTRPPVEIRGVAVGVAAVIKTGYATLSRNRKLISFPDTIGNCRNDSNLIKK